MRAVGIGSGAPVARPATTKVPRLPSPRQPIALAKERAFVSGEPTFLTSAFEYAVEIHLLSEVPEFKQLNVQHKRKSLRTIEQINTLANEALRRDEQGELVYMYGDALADFTRLMAFTGSRCSAALDLHW